VNALLGEKFPARKNLRRHRLNSRMPSSKRSAIQNRTHPPRVETALMLTASHSSIPSVINTIAGFLIAPDSDPPWQS